MDDHQFNERLSRLTTHWSLVFDAHQGRDEAASAQRGLLQRYGGAVYRYLLGALRDADAAQDVAQEFAYCFLRGDFHKAAPERGRFRDYVRAVLSHLVSHHHRQQAKQAQLKPLPSDVDLAAVESEGLAADREFVDRWRQELLNRAWDELQQVQESTGQPVYTMLRFRAEHPEIRSAAMAEQLSARLGKSLTAAGVRQTLHRARERFAELLVEEVARSLQTADTDSIEQELIDLDLLSYCKQTLQERRGSC